MLKKDLIHGLESELEKWLNEQFSTKEKFEKLIDDNDYRELLFMNVKKYSFRENKTKVVKKILELL